MINVYRKSCCTLAAMLITALCSCPPHLSTELNRCISINEKIDAARQHMGELDARMAFADDYESYAVGSDILEISKLDGKKIRVLTAYPIDKDSPSPVVLFSHGLTASAESQQYLLQALAKRGYVVLAPDHLDPISFDRIGLLEGALTDKDSSTDAAGALIMIIRQIIEVQTENVWDAFAPLNSLDPEQIIDMRATGELLSIAKEKISYRLEDIETIRNVLPELNESDPTLKGKIIADKIILAGHSLGGTTMIAIASENRYPIEALICLSPASQPFTQTDLQKINAPVLYMSGDLDGFHDETRRAFDLSPSPKMLQNIKNGGHIIFTDFPFLYGLGIPFASEGETGFTDELPITGAKSFLYPDYPAQLKDYQSKALTIARTVCAFISQAEGDVRGTKILNDSVNSSFVCETAMQ